MTQKIVRKHFSSCFLTNFKNRLIIQLYTHKQTDLEFNNICHLGKQNRQRDSFVLRVNLFITV